MRTTRVIAALLCGGLFIATPALAQKAPKPAIEGAKPGEWTLDFEAAKAAAAEKNMPILLVSLRDACGLCAAAKQNLLAQPAWAKYAKENLFLVWVDLPDTTTGKPGAGIPEKYQDMNKTLGKFFGGGQLPLFAVVDSDGETLLGNWSGVDSKKSPEYFSDLVKSYTVMRASKPAPAAPAAGVKKPAPGPAAPPPGTIKPAKEGAKLGEWTMDFEAAQKFAAEKNSIILLYFTGSDWNRQSKASNKAIFARPGFDKYAANNNILLVHIDFPEDASLVPEQYVEKFRELRKSYIPRDSFPAAVLVADDGFLKLASFDKTLPTLALKEFQDAVKPHIPKKPRK